MYYIIKRDGVRQPFNPEKIKTAVLKAFKAVDGDTSEYAEEKAQNIADYIEGYMEGIPNELTIDDIQSLVEHGLMATKRKDVATAYIEYRHDRDKERKWNSHMMSVIKEKLQASNVQNQNANVDEHSFGGRKGEADSVLMKEFALDNCMSEKSKNRHLNNEIYIHDLDSYAVGMHNCCARETKFCTTNDGVRSFEDYQDGDQVSVLTPYSTHCMATVHNYGVQKLNKITFSFAGQRFVTERFTANHRWLLADGTETTELKVGDQLKKAPILIRVNEEENCGYKDAFWERATDKEKYYWCLGFVLADGTEAYRWSHGKKNEDIKFIRMRLCGDKIKWESRFAQLKHSTKEMANGDLYLTFSSTIGFRKQFPNLTQMTRSEKAALMAGLYAADGQHSGSRKSILTTNEQIASFIENEAPALGWFILNINDKTGEKTNYATRGFTKEYTFIGDANKYYWTVVDIQEDAEEEVWCLDVEDLHSFVLPNGITTGNCLSVPFDDLLANGFNTRQTDIRPANSINTAFQLVAVIFQLQSLQQFGGVSATHLDWTMVPYVRKSFKKHYANAILYIKTDNWKVILPKDDMSINDPDYQCVPEWYKYAMDMTEKELVQAVEGMYHNLNTLQSRSGNQLPFTSINYGTCTLPEGRMVIKALLNGSIKGVGKYHRTPIFPCGIFQCMKAINRKPDDPNYDLFQLALESTAKRLYPNYANVDWSGNAGYDIRDPRTYFSTMGCRTANGFDINGFGQLKDGRGNICPVTIILPTIAMEAKEYAENRFDPPVFEHQYIECFLELLDKAISDAKDMLIERFEYICSQDPSSAKFMYENGTMAGYVPEEGIRSALKHGTLALGQIGLAETLQILVGCDHTTKEGMELAKRIEQLFKDRCAQFKEEYKLNFGVYYTPAENLCYTSMQKFKAKYGEIPNVSDREYFTNSTHVPVWKEVDPFEKINIESQLTGYSSAGCITYVEFDVNAINNIEALEAVVNYAMDKDIPYFAINTPNDMCTKCGYTGLIDRECPECGGKDIQRLRRVTGYLTGDYLTAFNKGKQAEVRDRFKHTTKWNQQYKFDNQEKL